MVDRPILVMAAIGRMCRSCFAVEKWNGRCCAGFCVEIMTNIWNTFPFCRWSFAVQVIPWRFRDSRRDSWELLQQPWGVTLPVLARWLQVCCGALCCRCDTRHWLGADASLPQTSQHRAQAQNHYRVINMIMLTTRCRLTVHYILCIIFTLFL